MKFRRNPPRTTETINSSALPDIVFMLLFFFMVTTVMREDTPLVDIQPPMAKEVQKIERKDLMASIFVGPLRNEPNGPVSIQIDDQLVGLDQVGPVIAAKRDALPEYEQKRFVTVIKADADAEMGLITQIKQELRKVQALKIQYSTLEKEDLAEMN